jgi:hypothetical protein
MHLVRRLACAVGTGEHAVEEPSSCLGLLGWLVLVQRQRVLQPRLLLCDGCVNVDKVRALVDVVAAHDRLGRLVVQAGRRLGCG